MPVFISYSHQDKDFANKLARQLVNHKVHVWIDFWELHVGDSIIEKLQDAIKGASALLVILSKASVSSEWCKKELNSGLMRELEEKRVVIMPVLLEDCIIPLFLKEKLFADFRTNFDSGLKAILESISKVTNEWQSRLESPEWHIDWSVDWGQIDSYLLLKLIIVEQVEGQPYSALSIISIIADKNGTEQYEKRASLGQENLGRIKIFEELVKIIKDGFDLTILLEDQFEKTTEIEIYDKLTESHYSAVVSARRLGEDTGRDIVLHLGKQICQIVDYMKQVSYQP